MKLSAVTHAHNAHSCRHKAPHATHMVPLHEGIKRAAAGPAERTQLHTQHKPQPGFACIHTHNSDSHGVSKKRILRELLAHETRNDRAGVDADANLGGLARVRHEHLSTCVRE